MQSPWAHGSVEPVWGAQHLKGPHRGDISPPEGRNAFAVNGKPRVHGNAGRIRALPAVARLGAELLRLTICWGDGADGASLCRNRAVRTS